MSLKFNPRTGEWDDVPDLPSDRIARIGNYFKAQYDTKESDMSTWVIVAGTAIVILGMFAISTFLGILAIAFLFFEKTRYYILVAGGFVSLLISFILRWIFYNTWTLICFTAFTLGLLL